MSETINSRKIKVEKDADEASSSYQVLLERQPDAFYFPFLYYIYAALVGPYLIWRFAIVNWDIWYGPLIYLADFYGGLTTLLFLWMARRVDLPVHHPSKKRRKVDAFVPTYNEPLYIVEATVLGAKKVRGIKQIFVLDDGNRPEVKSMAQRLKVRYYARTTNEHAKAGNMNNGLKYSRADYILCLDADHVPLPEFLERTMGYFDDPKLAFVQTPQTFYNTDSFLFRKVKKGLWFEQIMFYNCIQKAKNYWNSAFFVGTSAVLRREAIDDVGGFATGTATEDLHTSLRIHARGWKSLYLPESLAHGLESSSLKEFYKQRRRWAAGALGLLFRSSDSPLRARGLTFPQRLNYLSATLAHLQGTQKLLYVIVSGITAFTLSPALTSDYENFTAIFICFLVGGILFTTVYSRGTYHLLYSETYGLANMMAHIGGIKGVIKVQRKFSVSHKMPWRNEKTLIKPIFWVMSFFCIAAISRASYLLISDNSNESLLISSIIFTGLQLSYLTIFLIQLSVYEKQAPLEMSPNTAITDYRGRLETTPIVTMKFSSQAQIAESV